jgi:hypothetical protein
VKESAVIFFKVLSRHSLGKTGESHGKFSMKTDASFTIQACDKGNINAFVGVFTTGGNHEIFSVSVCETRPTFYKFNPTFKQDTSGIKDKSIIITHSARSYAVEKASLHEERNNIRQYLGHGGCTVRNAALSSEAWRLRHAERTAKRFTVAKVITRFEERVNSSSPLNVC